MNCTGVDDRELCLQSLTLIYFCCLSWFHCSDPLLSSWGSVWLLKRVKRFIWNHFVYVWRVTVGFLFCYRPLVFLAPLLKMFHCWCLCDQSPPPKKKISWVLHLEWAFVGKNVARKLLHFQCWGKCALSVPYGRERTRGNTHGFLQTPPAFSLTIQLGILYYVTITS